MNQKFKSGKGGGQTRESKVVLNQEKFNKEKKLTRDSTSVDKVKFSDQIRKKLKDMRPLQ